MRIWLISTGWISIPIQRPSACVLYPQVGTTAIRPQSWTLRSVLDRYSGLPVPILVPDRTAIAVLAAAPTLALCPCFYVISRWGTTSFEQALHAETIGTKSTPHSRPSRTLGQTVSPLADRADPYSSERSSYTVHKRRSWI